eukprot:813550_1
MPNPSFALPECRLTLFHRQAIARARSARRTQCECGKVAAVRRSIDRLDRARHVYREVGRRSFFGELPVEIFWCLCRGCARESSTANPGRKRMRACRPSSPSARRTTGRDGASVAVTTQLLGERFLVEANKPKLDPKLQVDPIKFEVTQRKSVPLEKSAKLRNSVDENE